MIEVNLHPSAEKKRDRKSFLSGFDLDMPDLGGGNFAESLRAEPWRTAFVALLLLVGLVIGGFWLAQRSQVEALETRLEEARSDSARLADLRELSDSLTNRQEQIRERVRLVEELDQNRYVWPHLMDEIAVSLPERAWIRALKRQGSLPNMGVQIIGSASTPLVVTDFVRNLESSAYVDDVQIVGTNKQNTEGLTTQSFTLDAVYSPPRDRTVETAPAGQGGG